MNLSKFFRNSILTISVLSLAACSADKSADNKTADAQEVAENSFWAALAAGAAQGFASSSNCCGGAGNSFAVFGFGATRPLNLPGLCQSFR